MPVAATATAPDGTVHQLDGDRTRCGQDTRGWSHAVAGPQQKGLVSFCPGCEAAATPAPQPPRRAKQIVAAAAIAVFAAAVAAGVSAPGMYHHGPPSADGTSGPGMYHHG
jgi:hypothetical protein